MTVIDYRTGEIVEYDRAAAERRAERITLRLDAIAENYARVLPLIREAIEKRDDIALGYRSPGEYVSDRFGQSLAGLGVEVRRAVVGELTEAGLSTRAIAPIVGTGNATVHRDLAAGVPHETPDQTPESPVSGEAAEDSGQTPEGEERPDSVKDADSGRPQDAAAPRPPVTGIDGKEYPRTAPKKVAPPKPRRRPLPDAARDAGWELRKSVERLERIAADDRFAANAEQVTPHLRSHLSHAIEVCQDLLERINNN